MTLEAVPPKQADPSWPLLQPIAPLRPTCRHRTHPSACGLAEGSQRRLAAAADFGVLGAMLTSMIQKIRAISWFPGGVPSWLGGGIGERAIGEAASPASSGRIRRWPNRTVPGGKGTVVGGPIRPRPARGALTASDCCRSSLARESTVIVGHIEIVAQDLRIAAHDSGPGHKGRDQVQRAGYRNRCVTKPR